MRFGDFRVIFREVFAGAEAVRVAGRLEHHEFGVGLSRVVVAEVQEYLYCVYPVFAPCIWLVALHDVHKVSDHRCAIVGGNSDLADESLVELDEFIGHG